MIDRTIYNIITHMAIDHTQKSFPSQWINVISILINLDHPTLKQKQPKTVQDILNCD